MINPPNPQQAVLDYLRCHKVARSRELVDISWDFRRIISRLRAQGQPIENIAKKGQEALYRYENRMLTLSLESDPDRGKRILIFHAGDKSRKLLSRELEWDEIIPTQELRQLVDQAEVILRGEKERGEENHAR